MCPEETKEITKEENEGRRRIQSELQRMCNIYLLTIHDSIFPQGTKEILDKMERERPR